jgi:dTMP kinase
VARLQEAGHAVVSVREPGGTPLGEKIRPWVKSVEDIAPETELLLFTAARAQLVATVIEPSIRANKVVVADRFADSTVAYQGYGRGVALELVRAANRVATGDVIPDITFLLDQPAEDGLTRVGAGQNDGKSKASHHPGQLQMGMGDDAGAQQKAARIEEPHHSKFEHVKVAFHRKVRSGFLKLAGEEPNRILVMDAAKPEAAIAEAVWQRVEARLS